MKIFLLLIFLSVSQTKKVSRIIRTHYDLPLTFRGEKFIELINEQYGKFDEDLQYLQEKIQKCIQRKIIVIKQAQESCLGMDFEVYEDRFNLFTYKIENIFENMIELAFNENCLDEEENSEQCYMLLDDIKILRFNNYLIIKTIRHNKIKYIKDSFTQDHFNRILESIEYAITKYEEYKETLEDKKIVMKGLLWNYFLEEKAKNMGHNLFDENDEDLNLLDEVGGEDKFFAKKLMGQIETNFSELQSEFQDQEDENEDDQQENNDRQDLEINKNNKDKKHIKQNYQFNYIFVFFLKSHLQLSKLYHFINFNLISIFVLLLYQIKILYQFYQLKVYILNLCLYLIDLN